MYVATEGEPTFARRESGSYVYTNHQTMWWTIDTKLGQKSSTQEKNKKKKLYVKSTTPCCCCCCTIKYNSKPDNRKRGESIEMIKLPLSLFFFRLTHFIDRAKSINRNKKKVCECVRIPEEGFSPEGCSINSLLSGYCVLLVWLRELKNKKVLKMAVV